MKRLLAHLKAHLQTCDPWILVYDNQGTFEDCVGEQIVITAGCNSRGSLFGVPLRRESAFEDVWDLVPRSQMRVAREHLEELIERIEYNEGHLKYVA